MLVLGAQFEPSSLKTKFISFHEIPGITRSVQRRKVVKAMASATPVSVHRVLYQWSAAGARPVCTVNRSCKERVASITEFPKDKRKKIVLCLEPNTTNNPEITNKMFGSDEFVKSRSDDGVRSFNMFDRVNSITLMRERDNSSGVIFYAAVTHLRS
ncbi:hypothetical protein TNCV_841011 [Trichonephila clavipes]|nr:hypothetical protein TNCV_841011 [Trichonephila clavipes]